MHQIVIKVYQSLRSFCEPAADASSKQPSGIPLLLPDDSGQHGTQSSSEASENA